MTPRETAALLAVCSGFDNRKPDPDVVTAWSVTFADQDFVACRDAVVTHYRRSREWIMPVDIIGEVKRARAKRIAEDKQLTPPPGLDPDDTEAYARWLASERQRSGDGEVIDAPALPAGRDVSALGEVGASVRAERIAEAREAMRRQQAAQEAQAEDQRRAEREARAARKEAARNHDQQAREALRQATETEGDTAA